MFVIHYGSISNKIFASRPNRASGCAKPLLRDEQARLSRFAAGIAERVARLRLGDRALRISTALRAFAPLCDDFIVAPDGSFVGE